jgi:coenzyme Q-binding protein COQ10
MTHLVATMKSLLPTPPVWRRFRLQRRGGIISSSEPFPFITTIRSVSTASAPPRSISISLQRHRQPVSRPLSAPSRQKIQNHTKRSFHLPPLSSLFPSSNGNGNNGNNNNNNSDDPRTLRATRTLPFPPSPLFDIIACVESYSEFLPFLTASTVTARDPNTGHPTQAFLTVGYGPFSETFTSRVDCDRETWVVEARSGGGFAEDGKPVPGADEEVFSYLSTKWELVPTGQGQSQAEQQQTKVNLEIRFRFRNQFHAAMMSAVEDKVAGVMIEAFEKRIRERMANSGR